MIEHLVYYLTTGDVDRDKVLHDTLEKVSEETLALALYAVEDQLPKSVIFGLLLRPQS